MSVKVTVKTSTGQVVNATKNPEIFQVRVEESRVFYEGGFRTVQKRSALINGPEEELKAEFAAGQVIPGQIIVLESLTAFRKDDISKDLKIAGKTGVVCTLDDQPIFRTTFFTSDMDAKDQLIQHDNTNVIKNKLAELVIAPADAPEAATLVAA